MSDELRCLIVDDQPVVRVGLRGVLGDRYDVEEAASGTGALQMLTDFGPFDVAVIDLGRPSSDAEQLSGTAAIKALRRARPALGIVARGARAERQLATEAIRAGATAYVAKCSPPEALNEAVASAAEAETYIDPAAQNGGARAPRGRALTKRQREILQLIADGARTPQVAKRLGLSAETVRTHTKAILARLEARGRAHAVAIALRSHLID